MCVGRVFVMIEKEGEEGGGGYVSNEYVHLRCVCVGGWVCVRACVRARARVYVCV